MSEGKARDQEESPGDKDQWNELWEEQFIAKAQARRSASRDFDSAHAMMQIAARTGFQYPEHSEFREKARRRYIEARKAEHRALNRMCGVGRVKADHQEEDEHGS